MFLAALIYQCLCPESSVEVKIGEGFLHPKFPPPLSYGELDVQAVSSGIVDRPATYQHLIFCSKRL